MPYVARTFAPRELAGSLVNRSWLTPDLRVSQIAMRGFVWNPSPGCLPLVAEDHRVYVHWVVGGRGHLLASGQSLEAGDALVARSFRASLCDQRLALVGDHQAIALRFEAGVRPVGADVFRLSPERAKSAYDALTRARCDADALAVARDIAAMLAAHGLSLAHEPLSTAPRAGDSALAAGLTRALTFAAARPALGDLRFGEMAVTERQLHRRLRDFFRYFRMPFATWRDMRQSFCLTTASLAMTLPDARTDHVARASGFASATSLCHALQRVGLASPQELAAASRELSRAL